MGSTVSGEFPARAAVGEPLPVSAVVFREGHDAIGASVVVRDSAGRKVTVIRMEPGAPGTDRWHADVVFDQPGAFSFSVEAWSDPFSTWHHAVTVKIEAGQGSRGPRQRLRGRRPAVRPAGPHAAQGRAPARARRGRRPCATPRWAWRTASPRRSTKYLQSLVHVYPVREYVTASPRYPLWIDRSRALFGSWYEFFPRSIGAELAGDPARPGQAGAARHVPRRDRAPRLRRVAGLRRRLRPADPPDRRGQPQGPEQHPRGGELGRRVAVGDRLEGRRARRHPPRARHDGRLHGLRRPRPRARHGDRARPRAAVRARTTRG